MRIINDGEEVEHELVEHVRTEDEEFRDQGKKKANRASKQMEAEEALEEESPRRGYPEDTVIPIAIRY